MTKKNETKTSKKSEMTQKELNEGILNLLGSIQEIVNRDRDEESKVSNAEVLDALTHTTTRVLDNYVARRNAKINGEATDLPEITLEIGLDMLFEELAPVKEIEVTAADSSTSDSAIDEEVVAPETVVDDVGTNEVVKDWTPEYVDELANQIIRDGSLQTLVPLPQELLDEVNARVQVLRGEVATSETDDNVVAEPAIGGTEEVPNVEVAVTAESATESVQSAEAAPTWTPEYIDELANQIINTGSLQTLTPLPQELLDLVNARVQELNSPSMQVPEQALLGQETNGVEGYIAPDGSQWPSEADYTNYLSNITQQPTTYVSPDGTQWNSEADYVNYVDYYARYYLSYGTVNTPTPISEGLLNAIYQRAAVIQNEQPKTM